MTAVSDELPVQPLSLTHQHIFSVINTRLRHRHCPPSNSLPQKLRVLDIGCGDGLLISFLQTMFEHHYPQVDIEIYGFDIGEVGYQNDQQLPNTISLLRERHPHVDWQQRINLRSLGAQWSYPPGFFDIAVSNQVLEHVDDLDDFLRNLKSSLHTNGFSVHLFPLGNHIVEEHTRMPFIHYVKDQESRTAYARLLNRIGLSRYRYDQKALGYTDPNTHAEDTAKFIQGFTCYRKFSDFYRHCNELCLSLSHHYTKDFYLAKARQLARLKPALTYRSWDFCLAESVLSGLLKYVSSVTLTIAPVNYDIGDRIRCEKEFWQRVNTHQREAAKQAA